MSAGDVSISRRNLLKLIIYESKFTLLVIFLSCIIYFVTQNEGIFVLDVLLGIVFTLIGVFTWTNYYEAKVARETEQEYILFHSRRSNRAPFLGVKSLSPKQLRSINSSLRDNDDVKLQLSHFLLQEKEIFLVIKGIILFILPFILSFVGSIVY